MCQSLRPKYRSEFFYEFNTYDRFICRVSDLDNLDQYLSGEINDRIDKCHIYLLGKRPRLSIVPGSIDSALDFEIK